MAFFDKLKNQATTAAAGAVRDVVSGIGCKTEKIVFMDIPETMEEFRTLPQAALSTPFETAALTVAALYVYPADRELCFQMMDYLRGPRTMTGMDKQFINDRFMDKDYVPRSYFEGSVPDNDYMPDSPYTIIVKSDLHSYDEQGFARLYVRSGGADDPRMVKLRQAKDGKWYLWEQSLPMWKNCIRSLKQAEPSHMWKTIKNRRNAPLRRSLWTRRVTASAWVSLTEAATIRKMREKQCRNWRDSFTASRKN